MQPMNSPLRPAGDSLRRPSKLNYLWHGKGREVLIRVCHNMGITDICTCDPQPPLQHFRYRPGSSSNPYAPGLGMKECLDCHHLQYPLQYVYDCDECTEPFLIDKFPPPHVEVEFLCFDCAYDRANEE